MFSARGWRGGAGWGKKQGRHDRSHSVRTQPAAFPSKNAALSHPRGWRLPRESPRGTSRVLTLSIKTRRENSLDSNPRGDAGVLQLHQVRRLQGGNAHLHSSSTPLRATSRRLRIATSTPSTLPRPPPPAPDAGAVWLDWQMFAVRRSDSDH